jgi:hypothetical protein
MIKVQVISNKDRNLYSGFRGAIENGSIRSFTKVKVKGGLKIKHKDKYTPGWINIQKLSGMLLAEVYCNAQDKEWKILQAFIGRIIDHFKEDIICINIQL